MSVTEITNRLHLEEVISTEDKNKLLILYFYSHDEDSDKFIGQKIREASLKYTKDVIDFLFIDSINNSELIKLFKVQVCPYLIIVKNGYVLRNMAGLELQDFVLSLDECSEALLTIKPSQNDSHQVKYKNNMLLSSSNEDALNNDIDIELFNSLSKLIQAVPVMIFIKGTPSEPRCRYSRQLVSILRENKVRFGYFDVLKNDIVRKGMKNFSDWPTFPQLYMNGEFVGGIDIIKETLEDNPDFFSNALI